MESPVTRKVFGNEDRQQRIEKVRCNKDAIQGDQRNPQSAELPRLRNSHRPFNCAAGSHIRSGRGIYTRKGVWTLRAAALAQLTQATGPLPGQSERARLGMHLHDRKAKAMRLPLKSVNGRTPRIDADAWIADTATVVGDVSIGPTSSVYYSAVIRGDTESITIGTRVNIQDAAVVHADPGFPARIGDDISVGHGAVLHGCTVESGCLVGMNATVLNGAVVGEQSLVAANALIPEGAVIPPRSLVAGVPGRVRRELSDSEIGSLLRNVHQYAEMVVHYRQGDPMNTT